MTLTVTVDSLFLFFLLMVFMFNIMSIKIPFVVYLSVGVVALAIIPNLAIQYINNNMIGWLGILMSLFTFAMAIINTLQMIRD